MKMNSDVKIKQKRDCISVCMRLGRGYSVDLTGTRKIIKIVYRKSLGLSKDDKF